MNCGNVHFGLCFFGLPVPVVDTRFRVLVTMDRIISTVLGRPVAIQDEE